MTDQLLTVLLVIFAVGIVWSILKAALKLTMKVFSCGLGLILAIGLLILLVTNTQIF